MSSDKPINANTAPKDQVAGTRRVLKEMIDTADRLVDEPVVKSDAETDPRRMPILLSV